MLKNITKDKIITENVEFLFSDKEKSKGLMFSKKKNDTAFFFYYDYPGYFLIHNLFVFYPIDIIYIDKFFKVVGVKKKVLPFTPLIFPPKSYKHFIEIASPARGNIEVGDILYIKEYTKYLY